ncbi:erg24, C-14 sterol reductase [Aspergillus hancockii]|nr:erg24, C-14 sterol reductase [Aspergillus hancockii]
MAAHTESKYEFGGPAIALKPSYPKLGEASIRDWVAPWRHLGARQLEGDWRGACVLYLDIVQLAFCAVGTYANGADFFVWTYITDHYVQILTANILITYALTTFVYIRSFSVDTKYPNPQLRELAVGGNTGNFVYDFYMGRELNPRVTLPFFGEVDIKTWCEMRSV